MPYVSISSSQHLTDDKIEKLQEEIAKIISIIPGKNSENCMIQIKGDIKTFMGGKASNATFCEIRMFGKAPSDKKSEFTTALSGVVTAELGELDRLFINFQEYFEWGAGPNYRSF